MAPRQGSLNELLFGFHAVHEALRAGRRHFGTLWTRPASQGRTPHAALVALARQQRIQVRQAELDQGAFRVLDRQGAHHQGVALEASPFPFSSLEQVLALGRERRDLPLLLLLDHIQDPHNLGAMMRAAENCGVHGIVTPRRRSCPMSPAVGHASAGALEHMHVVQVTNLNRTMEELKARGIWIGGLDTAASAAQDIATMDLDRALALVVGHEGQGLSGLARRKCDFLLRLAMHGRIASFNAASSVAIALYLARQARSGSGNTQTCENRL